MHKPQIHKNAISVKWIICTSYPKFIWRKLIYFLFFGVYKGEYGEYYIKAETPFAFCASLLYSDFTSNCLRFRRLGRAPFISTTPAPGSAGGRYTGKPPPDS